MVTELPRIALSAIDKEQLQLVYNTRFRLFISVYLVLFLTALLCSGKGINYRDRYSGSIHRWKAKEDNLYLSALQMQLVNLAVLESIVIGSGIIIYRKRVLAYKKDLHLGMKEMVPYIIIRKEYFEYTGQYFFALNDPQYLHHEVDVDMYDKCNVGDTLVLFRGVHSKYVFNKNGRFELM